MNSLLGNSPASGSSSYHLHITGLEHNWEAREWRIEKRRCGKKSKPRQKCFQDGQEMRRSKLRPENSTLLASLMKEGTVICLTVNALAESH